MKPRVLYKYRNWEDPKHKRLITHDEIFFASVSRLNDPFEGKIPFRYDLLSEENQLKIGARIEKKTYPYLTHKRARLKAKQRFIKSGHPFRDKKRIQDTMYKYIDENFGICTLSDDPLNVVMWTFYGNSHKGFCVGFDTDKLEKFLNNNFFGAIGVYDLKPVNYEKKLPELIPDLDYDYENGMKLLTTKSMAWEFEREWRLITLEKLKRNFPLKIAEGIICEIILGGSIPITSQQEIIDNLKKKARTPLLFKTKNKEDEFALEKHRIDY